MIWFLLMIDSIINLIFRFIILKWDSFYLLSKDKSPFHFPLIVSISSWYRLLTLTFTVHWEKIRKNNVMKKKLFDKFHIISVIMLHNLCDIKSLTLARKNNAKEFENFFLSWLDLILFRLNSQINVRKCSNTFIHLLWKVHFSKNLDLGKIWNFQFISALKLLAQLYLLWNYYLLFKFRDFPFYFDLKLFDSVQNTSEISIYFGRKLFWIPIIPTRKWKMISCLVTSRFNAVWNLLGHI